jgi:hypothetical protein
LILPGGLSAFLRVGVVAIPAVRRIANSSAMASAVIGPPGWNQWPIQFSEPAIANADSFGSHGLIVPSAMPSAI